MKKLTSISLLVLFSFITFNSTASYSSDSSTIKALKQELQKAKEEIESLEDRLKQQEEKTTQCEKEASDNQSKKDSFLKALYKLLDSYT